MSNLFTQLEKERERQQASLEKVQPDKGATEKKPTQKVTQISKGLSKPLSKKISKPLSTEAIETLVFQLRKVNKSRVNADIPQAWKDRLDDMAHHLKVGKYDLLMFIIAWFLGEVEESDDA
jgi:hypothetical protein